MADDRGPYDWKPGDIPPDVRGSVPVGFTLQTITNASGVVAWRIFPAVDRG